MHSYLAIDLGAESGRVVRGILKDKKLTLEEVGRFPTGMNRMLGHEHWDVLRLFESMKDAFCKSANADPKPESVGVDSWGVDFCLLAEDGSLLGLPVAYRDSRTDGMMERFAKKVPQEEIYAKTGIAFLQFNTLYQFFAMSEEKSPMLKNASAFLMMSDFFHYLFSGRKTNEFTNASTGQMLNTQTRTWDPDLLKAAGVSESLMQEIVPPGTVLGTLTEDLQKETGLGPISVIAPATHDTGSAVAAAPTEGGDDWCYISSGTWSLMGIESLEACCTEEARACNFTNEGGVEGTYRFLKNIMGLWLVQRCRAAFDTEYDYGALTQMAAEAPAFLSLIDPNDSRFLNPESMTEAIDSFCKETGQPVPDSPGAYVRCCLESLACLYGTTVKELEKVRQMTIKHVNILGGGTQNKLLSQMTADATGLPVVAGPIEATAIGNLIMQAKALGHIESLLEGREIVRNSFPVETYEPQNQDEWKKQRERFQSIRTQA